MKLCDQPAISVKGHVNIVDDLGNVLLDKDNAVHPQNMARIFARALANESNYSIYRIAYGNGGTTTDAAYTASFNTVNDGQPPDTRTWDSRLYNETYSEIVDEGNTTINLLLGTDPGTADPNVGTRPGGGTVVASDPTSDIHTSGPGVRSVEEGVFSQVIITSVINPDEPTGQTDGSPDPTFSTSFAFDEIGLYTGGGAASSSAGVADVNVGDKTTEDDTGLAEATWYSFQIRINYDPDSPSDFQTISFKPPTGWGTVTYGDVCEAINTGDATWNSEWVSGTSPLPLGSTIAITDNTIDYPSITGAQTFGFLRFVSATVGSGSSVELLDGAPTGVGDPHEGDAGFFVSLVPTYTDADSVTETPGADAGSQNDPLNPENERERLLTHLIFTPVLKAAERTLTVTYTLTINVARTTQSL